MLSVAPGSAAERWNHKAVGVGFQLPSWVQGDLRRGAIALRVGMVLAAASLALTSAAEAQTWTGATTNYDLSTNWIPSLFAPPVAPLQTAIFDTSGSTSIVVTSGPIAPFSWTFVSKRIGDPTISLSVM